MIKAEIGRQLMIRVGNEVGSLADITTIIAHEDINLVAICAYEVEGNVALMFVTEDNNNAKKVLERQGYNVREEEVVLLSVDNRPGALQLVTSKIAEAGISLHLIYGSVNSSDDVTRLILISNNNMEVMLLVKTELERG